MTDIKDFMSKKVVVNAMLGILNGQAKLNVLNVNLHSCRLKHVKTL